MLSQLNRTEIEGGENSGYCIQIQYNSGGNAPQM